MTTKVNNRMIDDAAFNIKDYGAVGDGVADDTAAIQSAINDAIDFTWEGSVIAQNNKRDIKRKVHIPAGKYRVTSSILLSPMVTLEGVARMGYWTADNQDSRGGSVIVGDFVDQTKYVLDTANYDATGTRDIGRDAYQRNDHDGNLVAQNNCVTLKNFAVISSDNSVSNFKGAINLCLAHESELSGLFLRGGAVGLNLSTSWGGSVRDCNIRGLSAGVTIRDDITTYVFDNCYITSTYGPNPNPWFDYPAFPSSSLQEKTACIAARFSSPHLLNCTFESAEHAVRAQNVIGGAFDGCYHEKILDYLYVLHSCDANLRPSWTVLPAGCQIGYFDGSSNNRYIIDIGNCDFFDENSSGITVTQFTSVHVSGNKGTFLGGKYTIPSRVAFDEYSSEAGYCDIYLSSTGDDDNLGYRNNSYAVATWQEALYRMVPGLKNRIFIPAGDTVTTKYNYRDGTNAFNKLFNGYDIEVICEDPDTRANVQVGARSNGVLGASFGNSSLRVSGVNFLMDDYTGTDSSYEALFNARGTVNISMFKSNVAPNSHSNLVKFMGPYFTTSGLINLNIDSGTWSDVELVDAPSGGVSNLMWTANHTASTFTGCTSGDTTQRILGRSPFN